VKVALLSDVHGNLPAFRSVLEEVEELEVNEIWCLGDLVGYGAQPDECVELARNTCDLCLIGNHDLVVIDRLDIRDFSANAALAASWTRERIEPETRAYLEGLEAESGREGVGLYHASPRDPVWEYVLSTLLAELCFDAMEPRIGAIGHSHVALWFHREEDGPARGEQAREGTEVDLGRGEWLINPGGVGQPRDGDPRAAWLLLDTERWRAEWRRVEYPVDEAAEAIREAGLPVVLAERLYYGQ
jgi:diadenosine tetraphosphatase ApaH/serine/threonine PP2A family protein phosphatase